MFNGTWSDLERELIHLVPGLMDDRDVRRTLTGFEPSLQVKHGARIVEPAGGNGITFRIYALPSYSSRALSSAAYAVITAETVAAFLTREPSAAPPPEFLRDWILALRGRRDEPSLEEALDFLVACIAAERYAQLRLEPTPDGYRPFRPGVYNGLFRELLTRHEAGEALAGPTVALRLFRSLRSNIMIGNIVQESMDNLIAAVARELLWETVGV